MTARWGETPQASQTAAGCMFLLWQQPTDRALAGWCPFGYGVSFLEDMGEEAKMRWLEQQVERTNEELMSARGLPGRYS